MNGRDILTLKAHLGHTSNDKLAKDIGIGTSTLYTYLVLDGDLPRDFALACAALAAGLKPYCPLEQPREVLKSQNSRTMNRIMGEFRTHAQTVAELQKR